MRGVLQQIPLGDILELLGDSLDAQVAYVGADLRYRYANSAYHAWHAKHEQNIRGKPMADTVGRDTFDALRPFVDAALAGNDSEFDLSLRHPRDGKRSIVGRFVSDVKPDGEVNGFLQVLRDVTEGRRRQQADHERRAEQVRVERAIQSSEKRFRTMIDQSPLSMQIFDAAGNCVRANLSWQKLWRAKPEQLHRYNILEDPQFESAGIMPQIKRAFAGEVVEIPPFEYDPAKSGFSGRSRWIAALLYPVQAENEAQETILVLQDVTEERTIQTELQATKERLQLIVNTSSDAVITIDAGDRITAWDGQAAKVFGWTRDEILGQKLYETILPSQARSTRVPGMFAYLKEGARQAQKKQFQIEALHKNGHLFPAEVTISAARQNETTFYTVFVRDISEVVSASEELKRLNAVLEQRVAERTKELQTTNEELASAYHELEAFSYSVAHDLRNPLRRLAAIASILLEELSPEGEVREHLLSIKEFVRDMTRLIEDHLDFARFSNTDLNVSKVDFHALAWCVLRDIQSDYPNIDIRVNALPSLKVSADPQLLQVVLENLADNAAKFAQKTASPCVEIGTVSKHAKRIFYVRDNGIGFDQEFAHKLFLPFERLHRAEEYAGTGIGLFNAKRIIDRHGGKIWAESIKGKGATFYFTLGEV